LQTGQVFAGFDFVVGLPGGFQFGRDAEAVSMQPSGTRTHSKLG